MPTPAICEDMQISKPIIAAISEACPPLQRTLYEETKIIEVFNKILTKGVELGESQITDTRLAALNIAMIAETWAIKRWFPRKKYSMEDYIAKQIEFILRAANNEP